MIVILAFLLGLGCIAAGVGMIYLPAGIIAAGVGLVALAACRRELRIILRPPQEPPPVH